MSKIKNFAFILVLIIAILVTFYATKYSYESYSPNVTTNDTSKDKPERIFSPEIDKKQISRLTTNVVPINYDLKVQPFMRTDQFYFNGTVSILANCKEESTDKIQLNVNGLEIANEQILIQKYNAKNETELKISKIELKDEVLTLQLDKKLVKNQNYTIFIPFKGYLNASLSGFYKSDYNDVITNGTRSLALTQFEATKAREAFPCFDEPAFKATFNIEITHWKNMTAISNMPSLPASEIDSDWVNTKFEKTVKMSTYLVAFAVGDFEFNQNLNVTPKYRIFTRRGKKEQANKAIDYGPKILKHFEDYFGIAFPLPKLDMLASPDFGANAMENWGLITYREARILFDEKFGSVVQLYGMAILIAHELSHQWFGNLVTPKFWNDIWLNEGFATYMEYQGVHALQSNEYNNLSWPVWEQFIKNEIHDVLILDSLKSSHPISIKVYSPKEISSQFDRISYGKGACIIRMMVNFIGEKVFKEGVKNYLNAFKYSNAEQSDLWRYLQKANDDNNNNSNRIDVKKIMDSWTLKEGYPLITVTRDYHTSKVRFSQQRFLLNANETEKKQLHLTQYEVPISFTSKSEQNWQPVTKLWLHKTNNSTESFAIKELIISKDDWFIANLQQTGFYRVTYDKENWQLLIAQLSNDHTQIHLINRLQILDDLFRLAENGVLEYELALKALEYLKNEKSSLPWTMFHQITNLVNKMLSDTAVYGHWENFIKKLIEPAYKRFQLKAIGNNLIDSEMQLKISNLACSYNLKVCVDDSKLKFEEFMKNPNNNLVPPNVRATVYCTAIANGDFSEWQFLFKLYLKEQNAIEREVMLNALACTRLDFLKESYLGKMFNNGKSGIKKQDVLSAFKGIAEQNYGKPIVFNYLIENWNKIYATHSEDSALGKMIQSFDSINSESQLNLFKSFYHSIADTKIGTAKRAFELTIDKIESNIRWTKLYENKIGDFLKERSF